MVFCITALAATVLGLATMANTQLEQYQQCREQFKLFRSKLLDIRKECPAPLVHTCCQLKGTFFAARSGVYEMKEQCSIGKRKTYIYCDMEIDGGGWLVIQRRISGTVPFNRTLEEYENGFGDASSEFWYGLKNILCLTKNKAVELRIDLEYPNGTTGYVHYKKFSISGASSYTASATVFKTSPGVKSNIFNPEQKYVYVYRSSSYRYYRRSYDRQLIRYYPNFCVYANCGSNPKVGGWWDTSCRGNPNGPGPSENSTVYAMWNGEVVTKTEIKIRQKSCITNSAVRCQHYENYYN